MEEHIRTLIGHGAKVMAGEGLIPLTLDLYHGMVKDCREKGMRAVTFRLFMPGLEEFRFLLAIWADGHVDSGCEDTVRWCMKENLEGARA